MYASGFENYQNYDGNGYNAATPEGDYAELNTLIIDGGHSYGACKLNFDQREGQCSFKCDFDRGVWGLDSHAIWLRCF